CRKDIKDMSKRVRMTELADQMHVELNPPAESTPAPQTAGRQVHKTIKTDLIKNKRVKLQAPPSGNIDLNPPFGAKDNFERMSITLPPEIRQRLLDESNRRKKERSPDWSISVIVREALAAHLK